jgi:hypothetical protein
MKVPNDNPIVANGRLAGRNSPKDWLALAAFEAMQDFFFSGIGPAERRPGLM